MNHHTTQAGRPSEAPWRHRTDGSLDRWAGRMIDVLAGVGLLACLTGVSALSGYIWGLVH